MKARCGLCFAFVAIMLLGCATGGTSRLHLLYQPAKELSNLQNKIGPELAVTPFKDDRPEPLYVGYYAPLMGNYIYYKSEPYPLENALSTSLSEVLSSRGIKTISAPAWTGKPEVLRTLDADSILAIEIKKFWIEGRASALGTNITSSIALRVHFGVKKEGKVFTRTIDLERNAKDVRLTPALAEQIMNQMLTEVFDTFLSNPY
jgi:hypothetical protein